MPTIIISKKELLSLVKQKIADKQLQETLSLNKINVDTLGPELKLEITPDRPDLLSAEGIARQLNGWLGLETGLKSYPIAPPNVRITAKPVDSRPVLAAAVVRGLSFTDASITSLFALQEQLDQTLGRNRKNVAIGLHDLAKTQPPFVYTQTIPDLIRFVPLGMAKALSLDQIIQHHPKGKAFGQLLEPFSEWPVIIDAAKRVLSFPPVINSALTKVTTATADLFIDVTGTDGTAIYACLNILVAALADRGGKIEAVRINDTATPHLFARSLRLPQAQVNATLGLTLSEKDIQRSLAKLRYGWRNKSALIPPYRSDILHAVDLIEDVAIGYGFQHLQPELPKLPSLGKESPLEELCGHARELMVGLGCQEMLSYALTSTEKQYTRMNLQHAAAAEIKNPVSRDATIVRTSLLPSLLEALAGNKHRRFPQQLFEIGDIVRLSGSKETSTENRRKLAAIFSHDRANLSEIIAALNALRQGLGQPWVLRNSSHPSFLPGRCGEIVHGMQEIGVVGEIHPKVLESWGLEKPAAGFELDLEGLLYHHSQ